MTALTWQVIIWLASLEWKYQLFRENFHWILFPLGRIGGLTKQAPMLTNPDHWKWHIEGSVQDCSSCIVNALELLQSCTRPSLCSTNPYLKAGLVKIQRIPRIYAQFALNCGLYVPVDFNRILQHYFLGAWANARLLQRQWHNLCKSANRSQESTKNW